MQYESLSNPKQAKVMSVVIGVKSYSDFQKMLNQWKTVKVEYKLLKVEFDRENRQVHYMLEKG